MHSLWQISVKRTFKTCFWVQNHLLNFCSSPVNSQRLLQSQKQVWNVFIKDFWYTNTFFSLYSSILYLEKNIPFHCIKLYKILLKKGSKSGTFYDLFIIYCIPISFNNLIKAFFSDKQYPVTIQTRTTWIVDNTFHKTNTVIYYYALFLVYMRLRGSSGGNSSWQSRFRISISKTSRNNVPQLSFCVRYFY